MIFARRTASVLLIILHGSWLWADNGPVPVSTDAPAPLTDDQPGFATAKEALEKGSPVAAAKMLKPLAEAGQADAQYLLGFLCDLGLGVPCDPAAGLQWQTRASGQKHYWATLYLGWKYRVGLGLEQAEPKRGAELQDLAAQYQPGPQLIPAEWMTVAGSDFKPNYTRATIWLELQADKGSAEACDTLAQYSLGGYGAPTDFDEHFRWTKLAAEKGYPAALERLADYYSLGIYVQKDPVLAFDYLQKAAAAGRQTAQYALGLNYEKGDAVTADLTQAVVWYERAAKQNHLPAMNRLADLLRTGGAGGAQDLPKALRYSRQAAQLGSAEAMTDVAKMLRIGAGEPKDPKAAFELFREAAGKNYAYAQLLAGWMLKNGELGPPDYVEARRWLELAARNGNVSAMVELGVMYSRGTGMPKDDAAAFVWFEQAAREGDPTAQTSLAGMLIMGYGVEKDEAEALTWLNLAANQNSPQALCRLGYCYQKGIGVPVDLTAAGNYYDRALAAGSLEAIGGRLSLKTTDKSGPWLQDMTQRLAAHEAELSVSEKIVYARLLVMRHNPAADARKCIALLKPIADENGEALVMLAHEYIQGDSPKLGRQMLEKAADQNAPLLKYYLGLACLLGVGGPVDEARGARLLQEDELTPSSCLAYLYYRGLGLPKDLAEAVNQLKKTAAEGFPEAETALSKGEPEAILAAFFPNKPVMKKTAHKPPAANERARTPQYRLVCDPVYPLLATLLGVTGHASVEFIINREGRVQDVVVTKATLPVFAEAAVQAVRRWEFTPGMVDGRLVNVRAAQLIEFNLKDDQPEVFPGSIPLQP